MVKHGAHVNRFAYRHEIFACGQCWSTKFKCHIYDVEEAALDLATGSFPVGTVFGRGSTAGLFRFANGVRAGRKIVELVKLNCLNFRNFNRIL